MIEIPVFLLMCAPPLYKLLPLPYTGSILGPIAVIFENTAVVCGLTAVPPLLLSDSNAPGYFKIFPKLEHSSLSKIPS
jgi:hypothetical protein